ncbi:MAG: dihydrodipicolinate synthase family protein [Planctomycetaceae bacterium]
MNDTAATALVLKGVIPPMVTPLAGRDQLDHDALERIIEHILGGGVHGLFVLGSTGEAPSLSNRVKQEVVERSVKQVDGRVPLLVGVTDTSFTGALELARFSADQGADAVVVAPPYYFPAHQDDLQRYFVEFAAESPLPVILYNIPSHTKVDISLATAERLLDVPNIIAFKDSSGNMLYFNRLLELASRRPGFPVFMGPEELLGESVLIGGSGGVCGGANLVPSLYVELYNAANSGELRLIHRLQQRLLRVSSRIYGVGDPPSGYLKGLKCAMSVIGLCSDRMAEPLYRLNDDKRSRIEQHLNELELALESTVR